MKSKTKNSSIAVCRCLTIGIVGALLSFFFASCKKEINPLDLASQAAMVYYENLIHGDVEQFVDGSAQIDSISDDYRQRQISNVRMYMDQIKQAHGGLLRVELDTAMNSIEPDAADVLLRFHYNDSTSERVLVPMVCKKGLWLLR